MTLAPFWTLFAPGLAILLVGAIALVRLGWGPVSVGRVVFDVHTMQVAALLVLVGYQAVTTAVAARIYAVAEEIGPPSPRLWNAFRFFTLERGILAGVSMGLAGGLLSAASVASWIQRDFGPLEPAESLRPLVLGTTLLVLGAQTLLMSFLYSMLGIRRRNVRP